MSIIPKINVGVFNKKERHNLSCDSQTTLNFGEVIPTFCRELIPDSRVSFDYNSLVRLSSMPRPTFGRMSLRNYATFQKYSDLYKPFDNLLAGQPFTESNGVSIVPEYIPSFTHLVTLKLMLRHSIINPGFELDFSDDAHYSQSRQEFINRLNNTWTNGISLLVPNANYPNLKLYIDYLSDVQNPSIYSPYSDVYNPNGPGGIYVGDGYIVPFVASDGSEDLASILPASLNDFVTEYSKPKFDNEGVFGFRPPSPSSFDFCYKSNASLDYPLYFTFKPVLKHLRKIFIGLGYQFSPIDADPQSPLKLLAYYKAWFELFMPQRNKQFTDTNCYKVCKLMESVSSLDNQQVFVDFVRNLAFDTYYYFPADYFSMSLSNLGDNTLDSNEFNIITTPYTGDISQGYNTAIIDSSRDKNGVFDFSVTPSENVSSSNRVLGQYSNSQKLGRVNGGSLTEPNLSGDIKFNSSISPLVLNIAQRLLQYTNKNNVIGRNIREYLRVHYGITDTNIDSNGVVRVGNSRVDIDTHEVISQSETDLAYLGEYAGRGRGDGNSRKFDFTNDAFGVLINFSVIVPESGYTQGCLKENKNLSRYDFFTHSFDCMGYEVIENSEFKADYEMYAGINQPYANIHQGFGFVPRYSHYKVGRNILNGDLSLPSLRGDMGAYTLEKQYGLIVPSITDFSTLNLKYTSVPRVVSDSIRKLDNTDQLGNFNRIFNYTFNDVDHFVLQQVYNVNVWNTAKSLSNSFDTFEDDADNSTIDLIHQ